MKRLLLNGSPRRVNPNSRRIIGWLADGLAQAGAGAPAVIDLRRTDEREAQLRSFIEADEVVLVFPLYTDSVPGIVKAFIDDLAGVDRGLLRGKRFGFVVHSGFPESAHSEPVAAYLERLCARLGMTFVGRAVKGGSEAFQAMPEKMLKKTRERFAVLGRSLARDGRFDPEAVSLLSRPRRFGFGIRALWAVLSLFGLPDFYWKMHLKKRGAWEKRFDRPYAEYVKSNL